jgi:hypothetical protein
MAQSLPSEPAMRDKLRLLEMEFPPLKYVVVVTNELMYGMVVNGFLRDIAKVRALGAYLPCKGHVRIVLVDRFVLYRYSLGWSRAG